MNKSIFASVAIAAAIAATTVAHATEIMPNFDGAPTGWTTDRYNPATFQDIGVYQGHNNVLEIGISEADSYTNRPAAYQSQFYDTQGMGHTVSGGAGDTISADLYIPATWQNAANGYVRTDMWGVTNGGLDYPIIGYTNYGDLGGRFRIWDENTANGWVDLGIPVAYNDWTAFSIKFTGTSYEFSINGSVVYTDTTVNGSTSLTGVIVQDYNYNDDPALGSITGQNYTTHWSNVGSEVATPEPASLAYLAGGIVLIGAGKKLRDKKQSRKQTDLLDLPLAA